MAGIIIGELKDANFQRDVIAEHWKNGLQRITDLHPSLMEMNYILNTHMEKMDIHLVFSWWICVTNHSQEIS